MDLTDSSQKDSDPGMGNEVSHTEGVKQSVGGAGKVGQFHQVLLESEYAVPNKKEPIETYPPTNDIHHQPTLKIRNIENETALKAEDDPEKNTNLNDAVDSDYSLIEECKALISEAADRAVQRSLSRTSKVEQVTDLDEIRVEETVEEVQVIEQAKSVSVLQAEPVKPGPSSDNIYSNINTDDDDAKTDVKLSEVKTEKIESNIAESVKRSEIDVSYALKCGILTGSDEGIFNSNKKESKGKKRKAKSADNIFQREVIESVKQHFDNEDNLDTDNKTVDAKRSKGSFIAKMFKFSKRKPRTDTDVSVDIKTQMQNDIVEENVQENNVQPTQSVDSKETNNGENNKRNREVRRLNSLDSGIVVDKISEQVNNSAVEYAVVQKTKTKIKDLVKTNEDISQKGDTDTITKTVPQRNETENVTSVEADSKTEGNEVVYINGEKTDEDFVYINERAVDVEGLVKPVNTTVSETLPSLSSGEPVNKTEETQVLEDERQSNVSTDSGTSSGSKIRRSDVLTPPEKAKLKKKSWSFQLPVGGKKKQTDEIESKSVVSMDPNASITVETKKPKWRFGKFSFRKGSDDVSTSTPNLHNVGIPEDGDEVVMRKKPEDKKKMKLKKIKAKKEKKRLSKTNSGSLDQRSTSMIDIGRGESSTKMARRSIVEEDLQFTQTDVFEGVSLSDLSQDEDTEVSTNPAGREVVAKKDSNKKDNLTALNKNIDIAKSIVKTKSEKLAKQVSLEAVAGNDETKKSDETKLTKSSSFEDNTAATLGNTVAELHASLNPENTEDEYVNILKVKQQNINSAPQQNHENIIEDAEYAQVVKRKVNQEGKEERQQKVKSSVPEQVLKLDAPQVLPAETTEIEDKPVETTNITSTLEHENAKEEESKPPEDTEQNSGETAFSNMVYSDEEFRATLASMVKTKIDQEHEDDSDAYVELQQIVEDFSGDKEISQDNLKETETDEIKTEAANSNEVEEVATVKTADSSCVNAAPEVANEKTNTTLQDIEEDISSVVNEVVIEKTEDGVVNAEVVEKADLGSQENEVVEQVLSDEVVKAVAVPVESLITAPEIIKDSENTETDIPAVTKVNKEGSLIVLKDVGVQVPDIYMPLDKDKDFGFTANNVPCVSIGIQVTDKELDIEHVVVSMNSEDGSEKVSPAYF